jgi:hypothetical protein
MLICSERKVLLADCWWLVCFERKVLVVAKPNEQALSEWMNESSRISKKC